MATEAVTLNKEMQHHRVIVLFMVGGVTLTTLAISNDRALFSLASSDTGTPSVAYAFVAPAEGTDIGGLVTGPGPARNFVTARRVGTTGTPGGVGGQPDGMVAFGNRAQSDAPAAGAVATPAASSFAALGSSGDRQRFAGNLGRGFGGSSGGVGGSSFAEPDAPTPPGILDPVAPGPVSPVPEPATWLMMILGFGFIGVMLRRARRSTQVELVSAKVIAS